MRIATFNCNSIRVRLPAVLAWLDAWRPDLLALQETKTPDPDFPRREIEGAGWRVECRGEKSYNGVAVISRSPLEEVSFGLGDDDGASGTRLVRARLGDLSLVNTYVPQGQDLASDKFAFKLAWLARLKDFFAANFDLRRERVLWTGDLNVAPEPRDVYDSRAVWPHVCHCREVIDAFREITGLGFVDVFRKHLPEADVFTFWDYRGRDSLAKNRGWRIDHLLASAPLAEESRDCRVDLEPRRAPRPSDHTFVCADFSPA
ncbi:MAG: exodeoxyribonuclease III [Planctomycetota bacterium]|jgi:exodeoxyribonuclease-3|nr:exodeoxyribonuclease III [Planctomycetota bacterium]